MQQGDIIVVRLDAGPRLGRFVEAKSNRARISIGRNREARLPVSRVIHETGLTAERYETVEELSRQVNAVAEEIDLEEVWDVVCDDGDALTLTDIAELYWGVEPTPQQSVGLLIHLLDSDLRFIRDGSHFLPRDRETVAQTLERIQRQAQRAADSEALIGAFKSGELPAELTQYQSDMLDQIRGFVLHGDEYNRAGSAKGFLDDAGVSGRDTQRLAFETLVSLGLMSEDEHLALEREDISPAFPDDVLVEAETVNAAHLISDSDRLDLTNLTVFSIDDRDTKDRDDALSIEALVGPEDSCSYRVGIHITDAGALIPRGSALDVEADRRMSSLYLPEQTISMLPHRISSDRGSINPREPRAAISLIAELNEKAEVTDWKVARSVIQSSYALSYPEANGIISDSGHPLHSGLAALYELSKHLRGQREAKGALNFDRDELSVKVDSSGEISVTVIPRDAPSRSLVQEYMVLCNSLLAQYCSEAELPAPFRSQDTPDVSDIEAQFPPGHLRSYLMLRRLKPAIVATKPGAHGGLGLRAYTQATSPLRRYPDLMVQRQMSHHLRTGETLYDNESVTSIAHRADTQIRQMSRIENQRRQYFFLKWLDARRRETEQAGNQYVLDGIVLENPSNRAATVDLVDWPYRTRAALPNSTSPGDEVSLHLHGVDLWRRTAQFTLAVAQI
ncbi:MAG: RNB domain-containing ribonuclease [Dehalococcoidia bacterium]|nr:RNB domain-containing ribonuclease [Dehalococcoidia bacterium]